MMSLADILQLVVLCALLFFPLGYLTRHYQRRIRTTLRLMFFKPRYVKPAGVLRRGTTVKEGANKQVISSQADSLIKISRIWADFFPANTSNQPI